MRYLHFLVAAVSICFFVVACGGSSIPIIDAGNDAGSEIMGGDITGQDVVSPEDGWNDSSPQTDESVTIDADAAWDSAIATDDLPADSVVGDTGDSNLSDVELPSDLVEPPDAENDLDVLESVDADVPDDVVTGPCQPPCLPGYGCLRGNCVETGEMVLVPAGSFLMGCNSELDERCSLVGLEMELPYHEVSLAGYYIDKTEVTQGHFDNCVQAGECVHQMDDVACGYIEENLDLPGPLPERFRGDDKPVVCVTWEQARRYCEWAGKKLPTEARWEKAARGTDGRIFPWGNTWPTCDYAVILTSVSEFENDYGCGSSAPWGTCGKSPAGDSPYGGCDMAGNVWEWVQDFYGADYYVSSPPVEPQGPATGAQRVVRGGGYAIFAEACRVSSRVPVDPEFITNTVGFRCAMDVADPG